MKRPRSTRRSIAVAAAIVALAAGRARAEPSSAAPSEAAPAPGQRIVAGQSAVIGGNGAGARERALDEAFRQAVDQSLAELVDAPTRAAQARAVKAIEARARTYVRRYRALEEGEVNGVYGVRLEVEVDEAALRLAVERWGQSRAVAAPAPVVPGLLLVSGAAADAGPLLLSALVALGARAQPADPALTDTAAALAAAARAALPEVAFVSADATDEGPVRGTTKVAVACRVAARVLAAPAGGAVAAPVATSRAFADAAAAARAQCLTRAAGDLAARLVPSGAAPSAGDLRTVTVEADVVEPAAVVALLKDVRSIGSVSSAELRRVQPGHAEIRARTRAAAFALAPALARDAAGVLALSNLEVAGDLIRVRARLRSTSAP
jgi:hypothetical protein